MRKIFGITVIIVIVFILAAFTSLFIFQSISVDKNSYSSGEKVVIRYSEFGIGMYCTCLGPSLEIYHLENGKWETALFSERLAIKGSGYPAFMVCVNGTLRQMFLGWCDVVMCSPQIVNKPAEYEWDMKVFEGEESLCGNQTYTHYEKVDAPKGTYKAKYGMAEAVFSIQ